MTEAVPQTEFVETLKEFNNTIVTIRLYPAEAPQINKAVERGYKAIKSHLRQYGDFSIGLRETAAVLCGDILPPEILQSISNLIVYRQLELLELNQLLIEPGFDRGSFKQILTLFAAKVDQVKQEGGGRAFVARLSLDHFFPEQKDSESPTGIPPVPAGPKKIADKPLQVKREYVEMLFDRAQRKVPVAEMLKVMNKPSLGARILATGINCIFRDGQKQRPISSSPKFLMILEKSDRLVGDEQKDQVAAGTASLLLQHFNTPALTFLFSQEFPAGLGTLLSASLMQQMSLDTLGQVITQLREQAFVLRLTATQDSPEVRFLTKTLDRLLQTPKGKQYLGQEKAKSILETGEKSRQATRVQAGVQSLLQGNPSLLQSEELVSNLPSALQKLIAEGRENEATSLLRLLASQAMEGDRELNAGITGSLVQIGENLILEQRWEWLIIIAEPLLYWMEHSEGGDLVYEKSAQVLQALMSHCWETSGFDMGDRILSVFYRIRSGTLVKPAAVQAMVGRVQDRGIDRSVLPVLLEQCLAAPTDEAISHRLILQGPIISRFLVDALMQADNAGDRIKIIDLLTYTEQFLPPILLEKLAEPMPWYGKRNLLKLLSDTGKAVHLDQVYPFLLHEDLRVQREAFICIYKISGDKRKTALLRALTDAGEIMKVQVVRALVPFCDAEVAKGLGQLLEDREHYSAKIRDTLMANVCQTLGRCPCPEAIESLQQLLQLRGRRKGRKIGEKVWQAAEQGLNRIFEARQGEEEWQSQAVQLRKSALRKVESEKKPDAEDTSSITGLVEEKEIRKLLKQGDDVQAKSNLLELIAKSARLKRFSQAEQLREWLIEINSLALTEIIRAAEIIEGEKQTAIDKGHLEVWSGLYDVLTTEEFSTLYHALHHKQYGNEEVIVKKGSTQTSLFFITSGKVKLFYRDKGADVLVKTMGKGEILGAGTFFEASVWTISAACLGQAEISSLNLEEMHRWRDDFPALESKLNDFCMKFERLDEFFLKSRKDRRQSERHKISGRVTTTLLDNKGQSTGVNSRGELFDISNGGVSLFIRISKKENARLLLGRNLKVMLPIEETSGHAIFFEGVVLAVRAHHVMEYEYSVHVEFKEPLDKSALQRILQIF